MIKETLKAGLFAFRRMRYNRPVPGNPTSFGKMWQKGAPQGIRKEMCDFFGVENEDELTQTIIDNYSSSTWKLKSFMVNNHLGLIVDEFRKSLLKKIAEERLIPIADKEPYPITVTDGDFSMSVSIPLPMNMQCPLSLLPSKIDIEDVVKRTQPITALRIEADNEKYFEILMYRLYPLLSTLFVALSRHGLIWENDYEIYQSTEGLNFMASFNHAVKRYILHLDTPTVGKLTNVETAHFPDTLLEVKYEPTGSVQSITFVLKTELTQ